MATKHDVIGIGNAIVDVLTHADDDFIRSNRLNKGAMTLIDADRAEALYARMGPAVEVSGGSAANTLAGVASLGGRAAYVGKVCNDQLGEVFRHDIRAVGVDFDTAPVDGSPPTARCLVIVTPDAERTMNTYLGACVELTEQDIDPELIGAGQVTYLEGYLYDRPSAKAAFEKAAAIAHDADRRVSLTLSDSFCVDRHRDDFRSLVEGHIDILFANEDEIMSLYRTDRFTEALEAVRGECEIAAITRGDKGSIILEGPNSYEIEADPVGRPVDTTGAGDLYAAGFLHGFSQGCHLAEAGRLGGRCAALIIQQFGARSVEPLQRAVRPAGL